MYDLWTKDCMYEGTIEELAEDFKIFTRINIDMVKECLEKDYRYNSCIYFSYKPPKEMSTRELEKKKARPMC